MMLPYLFPRFVIRPLFRDWPRAVLLGASVTLAVAVFIAVMRAGEVSVTSFRSSLSLSQSGSEIRGLHRPLTNADVSRLRPHLAAAFETLPVLEASVDISHGEVKLDDVFTIGVDPEVSPLADSDLASSAAQAARLPYPALSSELAQSLQLKPGDSISVTVAGRTTRLPIHRIEPKESLLLSNEALVLDLALLQSLTARPSQIDYLIVEPRNKDKRAVLLSALGQTLAYSGEFVLEDNSSRTNRGNDLLAAFRLNIFVMVLMAMVVCAFAVFNSAQLSARERAPDISLLRTLGLSSNSVFVLQLSEAGAVGVLGGLAGLLLAIPLSSVIGQYVLGTVTTLYLPGARFKEISTLTLTSLHMLAFAAGVLASLCGALLPAWWNTRWSRRIGGGVASQSFSEPRRERPLLWLALAVLFVATAGLSVALSFHLSLSPFAHAGSFLLLLALITLSLPALLGTLHVLRRFCIARLGVPGLLAVSHIASNPRASSLALAANASAVCLLVGLSVMVGSFRVALEDWIADTIRADLYIRREAPATLPDDLASSLVSDRRVEDVVRTVLARAKACVSEVCSADLSVTGLDLREKLRTRTFEMLSGSFDAELLRNGTHALVSETAARKYGWMSGDSVVIADSRAFQVAGIYRDFSAQQGAVLLAYGAHRELFPAVPIDSLSVYLRDPSDSPNVRASVRTRFPHLTAGMQDSSELRASILSIFDQTFLITDLMRIVVAIICAFGFITTLLQLIWERRRELRTVCVLGASFHQIRAAILLEGLLVALPTLVLGLAGGLGLAAALVHVVNPVSFGWSFGLAPAAQDFIVPVSIVFAANLIPSIFLLQRLARTTAGAALSDE